MAADNSNADARRALTLSAPPPPPHISKDSNGPDNPIPLSPQWLLPKPGDNKASILTGDSPFNFQHGSLRSAVKPMAVVEVLSEVEKKKDVFRPSVREMDTGRRDRWREEERDTISSTRNNRWREVEKESGDPRRTELWADNSTRQSDARRAPSERWSDTNNREKHNDQRRESKWNSRWGPDDKDSDSWREKWSEFGTEGSREKGMSNSTNQMKDIEKESDHGIRPWRPNSSQSRGRLEPTHNSVTPNKQGTVFSYGRGRGETNTSVFTPGRGRISSSSSMTNSNTGGMPDRSDTGRGDSSILKYSRIKLLDIFRVTDFSNYRLPNDVFDVPSITQTEPLEPLAFSAPTSDELAILKGIDKGDVVSSGAPQTKEGSVGRSTNEATPARQTWTGSRVDFPSSLDDIVDDSNDAMRTTTHKLNFVPHGALRSEGITSKRADGAVDGEFRMLDKQPYNSSSWGSKLVSGSHALPNDLKELSEVRSRTGAWSALQKEQEAELRNNTVSSHYSNELHWQNNDGFLSDNRKDSDTRRHLSGVMERERDANQVINLDDTMAGDKSDVRRLHPCTSPEDLTLYYKDPQGLIQGPFSGSDIIGWYEAGYFGIDLLVRLAEAPRDAPFMLLGDVMPHLRMKARPPPGFAVPKTIDLLDASNRDNHHGASSVYGDLSKVDHVSSGQRNRMDPAVEAENRFLESLMSGNVGSSPHNPGAISEGKQVYLPAKDVTGEMNYLLAQRVSSERQRSVPTHPAYMAGRDGLHVPPMPEAVPGSPAPHSNILPPKSDSHQLQQPGQHVDLLSLLQASADKPSVSSIQPAVSGWSTFPDSQILNLHGGFNILQQTNQHMIPQSVFGMQQQRLPQQNQASLPHLASQLGDYPSGLLPPEKLIASGISLDPQVAALLQQQYLLNQLKMQSSAAVPDTTQISVLDKLLLLQEQQKLEKQQQQQQLMLLQQQQQLLLSKVLSENQSLQRSNEQTYAFPVDVSTGSTHHTGLRQSHGGAQMGSNDVNVQQDLQKSNYPSLSTEVSREMDSVVSSETSELHLPHQLFNQSGPSEERLATDISIDGSSTMGDLLQQISILPSGKVDSEGFALANVQPAVPQVSEAMEGIVHENADSVAVNPDLKLSVGEQVSGGDVSMKDDASLVEPSSTKESKPGSEIKKVSEKKTKKQRNKSQAASSQAKGSSKEVTSQTSSQNTDKEGKVGNSIEEESRMGKTTPLATENSAIEEAIVSDDVQKISSKEFSGGEDFGKQEWKADNHPKVWKSASGVKIKSLLEIQEEEQRRAQSEKMTSEITASVSQLNVATAWTGAFLGRESKTSREVLQSGTKGQSVSIDNELSDNSKSRKSQLHDVLAEEVLAKSVEVASDFSTNGYTDFPLPSQQSSVLNDSVAIDDDFVEAKDNKKNRKKAAKLKASGVKAPVASLETAISPLPVEKGKISRQAQEKEVLPVPPASPSLGDFVPWKGEQTKAMPSMAWSTESLKAQRPASLRDILMEQEKKTSSVPLPIPEPIPTIVQSNRNARGSGSRQVSGTSPAKSNATGSLSKQKNDDDLFWGPLDQVQPDAKQTSFPSLAGNSWGTRSSPQKGSAFPLTRQKSSSKKADASSRNSEAKDFRKWCESELLRLTGSRDTSFLEFCIKQSSSEAEMLLKENLGSFDPKHEFIDKFLNYKEFLPSDVIDIALQSQFSQDGGNRLFGFEEADGSAVDADNGTEAGLDASKASGKKKGKKGKKVSPSVLGFNVVSNRIMMGEIQSIED